jgi:polar amino acid transport system permease protein
MGRGVPPPGLSIAMDHYRPPPPAKEKDRIKLLDWIVLALVLAGVTYVAYRVESVLHYNWEWHRVMNFVIRYDEEAGRWIPNLLLQGLFTTFRLAFWSMIAASVIGVVMGICRTSDKLFPRLISRLYVELIRNIPPVVFIFVFYFFISGQITPLLGIDALVRNASPTTTSVIEWLFSPIGLFDNFFSGLICLAMFEGAYITEIVRAGIQSVEKGQWEAARAIGLSRFGVQRDIILPQAIRKTLPPLAGQFITLIKDSAIVSLISIQELTFLAIEVAATTTKVFETWITVGGLYFIICFSLAVVFARLEKRLAAGRH